MTYCQAFHLLVGTWPWFLECYLRYTIPRGTH